MASSRNPAPAESDGNLARQVEAALARHCEGASVCLGYSGGLDSTVLLHLLAAARATRSFRLSAMHVHHGLRPDADEWARHCVAQGSALDVPVEVVRVRVDRAAGKGMEAAARAARYRALARADADFVALAQHRDDQAETVLLQLLRGGGVKGCAAMAETGPLPAPPGEVPVRPRLLRPLLGAPRSDLAGLAARRGLVWVEDDSNADIGYARNYLRARILPALSERVPHAAATLARAAGRFAEAARLLDDLARIDAGGAYGTHLPVAQLAVLSPERRRNLLRGFLDSAGAPAPGSERLEEMLRQVLTAARDRNVRVAFAGFCLRRYRDALYVERDGVPPEPGWREWRGEDCVELGPAAGRLRMARGRGAGLDLERLAGERVTIRTRVGGERVRTRANGYSRSLKHLLQETGVPPWQRSLLPLVWCGDELVWIPGIGAASGFAARSGEESVEPVWDPPPGVAVAS